MTDQALSEACVGSGLRPWAGMQLMAKAEGSTHQLASASSDRISRTFAGMARSYSRRATRKCAGY